MRFSFNSEYHCKKLNDVCDVRDGTHDSPKYVKHGYPFITSKNLLDNGTIDFYNVSYICEEDYKAYSKRSKPDVGDILFGMIGTIGKPVIIKEKRKFAIKNVALIKQKREILNEYLLFKLSSKSILSQFKKNTDGGTQQFISLSNIRNLKICYPDIQEQHKVKSFLMLLDERINTQNKIIEKYKSLIKCICDSAEMSANRQLKDIANYNSSIIKESIVLNEGKYPVFGAAGICGYLDDYVFSKAGIAIVKDGAGVGRLLKIKNDKYSILGTMGLIETKNGISQDYLWLSLKKIKFEKYIVGSGIHHIYFYDYSSAKIPSLTDENFIRAKLCDLLLEKIKIDEDILTNYLKQKTFLLNNLFI